VITREKLRAALQRVQRECGVQKFEAGRIADAIADALGQPPDETPAERWARVLYDTEHDSEDARETGVFFPRWTAVEPDAQEVAVAAMRRVYHGIRAELLEEMRRKAEIDGLTFTRALLDSWLLHERRLAEGGEEEA